MAYERVLLDIGGEKLLLTIGKDGILWKLNRQSGAFVSLKETMFQNVFNSVDQKTGKVRYRSDIIEAKVGDWISACPSYWGGHDWQATAYSPEANALIIPLSQSCFEMKGRKVDMVVGSGGIRRSRFSRCPAAMGIWDAWPRSMSGRWAAVESRAAGNDPDGSVDHRGWPRIRRR